MPKSTLRGRWANSRLARGRVLGGAILCASVAVLAGCSDETENDGSIRGTLDVYVATMDDGTSRTEFRLRVNGGQNDERRLIFAREPDITPGTDLKVWGELRRDEIAVERFETVLEGESEGLGTSEEAIIDGTPYAARTFAYVLVNNGTDMTYSEAQANIDMFGTGASDASVKQWFLEASYGRQDLSGRVITGLSYTMTGCDTSAMATALRDQVDTAFGSKPQHYLWYIRTQNAACGWSGLAQLGTGSNPQDDSWYNSSDGCVVLVQEPAHNFGMQHSSSLRCGGEIFANNPSSCTHDEYGDRHDPMGGACRHTNAWQKGYQGWFGGCNSVRVNTSGAFTLHPLETECNGIQVLQIPMPVTTRTIPRSGGGGGDSNDPVQYYYLELRTRTGFDQSQTAYPTVLVHVGPDYRARTQQGLHTWILDMNPATTGRDSFDGMGQGQTFTDPAGSVSFTVQSLSASSASIQVTVPTSSANTCAFGNGATLAAPGPSSCSGGTGGMGGMGGTGGTAGTGGRGGAGSGGTSGSSGRGGAGMGGMAGNAGRGGAGMGGTSGNAGRGGAGGTSGNAGHGGMSGGGGGDAGTGPGGSAGEGGIAGGGFGGDAGMAGAGVAGAAGTTGAAGLGGGGGAGAGGIGGAIAGTAGSSGASPAAGVGGAAAGAGPVAGTGAVPPGGDDGGADDDPGCGCRVEKASPRSEAALWTGLLAMVAGGIARRRRSNQYKRLVK